MSQTNDINDQSESLDTEKVIEVSPNERYVRLNTLLGKGAYKVVYKAIDREVAWNSMMGVHSPDNKEMEHEIEILKSVRHPNVIAFHDAWCTKNEFVFVTELMTSGTLREYIRKLNLPNLKIVKRWSRQILKGLAYLHGYTPPIIHRDIKCDNIFINGAHGEVKIGDMGTAEMKMGKKYTIIGTPEFMAPEMYEELGYSEKVDIYAFGMCLLEMVTGEYPYGECRNAAQIYRKVSSGVKPACLDQIQNDEVLKVIENCIGPEEERMSAQEILEHSFLAVEPDVVLLTADPAHVHLTLQVVFKGMDKLSVKFDFNVETDTAEQVVREMIEEQVLPERYQYHITKEINRILRDIEKPSESEQAEQVRQSVWRRESDIRSELERTRKELELATERIADVEHKCEDFESRARIAEAKYRETIRNLRDMEEQQQQQRQEGNVNNSNRKNITTLDGQNGVMSTQITPGTTTTSTYPPQLSSSSSTSTTSSTSIANAPTSSSIIAPTPTSVPAPTPPTSTSSAVNTTTQYSDDTTIDVFVRDCAIATHRNAEKAHQWINKLKNQDIMTVGDLRDLHDEDWSGIGLTVFALRALKNMLKGKKLQSSTATPMTADVSATSTTSSSPPDSSSTSPH
ncbi:Serine/threonine-protein kinase pkpA [Halteromyces radiatus]|uniref:Serine/threonine-protein kinase pkpA n=1 Tax=Halteromyces radiatus TaxID=101107 RepID=UPI0022200EBE|nr:Serine/threonine-protein kinase pkpA [Halteromyces radiatus]KAI8100194.1 Serine/threonine-protein kinase pkpA [Halteromyces radiatus]